MEQSPKDNLTHSPEPSNAEGQADSTNPTSLRPAYIHHDGPNRPYRPRPLEQRKNNDSKKESNSFMDGNVADAMTEDFAKSMSRTVGYNDNIDMDQQSQEYWDKI